MSTGSVIWYAAEVLLDFLMEDPATLQGCRVLELGAGCGLVGMGVMLCAGTRSVLLSDVPEQCPLLESNVKLNGIVLSGGYVVFLSVALRIKNTRRVSDGFFVQCSGAPLLQDLMFCSPLSRRQNKL